MAAADDYKSGNDVENAPIPTPEEIGTELNAEIEVEVEFTVREYVTFMASMEGGMMLDPTSTGEVVAIKETIEEANANLIEAAKGNDLEDLDDTEMWDVSFTITNYGFTSMMAAVERGAMLVGPQVYDLLERVEEANSGPAERIPELHAVLTENYDPDEVSIEVSVVPEK